MPADKRRKLAIVGKKLRVSIDGQGQNPAFGPCIEGEAVNCAGRDVEDAGRLWPVCPSFDLHSGHAALKQKHLCKVRMAVRTDVPVKTGCAIHDPLEVHHIREWRVLAIEVPRGNGCHNKASMAQKCQKFPDLSIHLGGTVA